MDSVIFELQIDYFLNYFCPQMYAILLHRILCSSSCRVKCAYTSFPLSKQSRQLRCDCHHSLKTYWARNCTKEVRRMCKVSVLLKSSNCFLHLALPALFYLRQRSHLMPGNGPRVRFPLGANVNILFYFK